MESRFTILRRQSRWLAAVAIVLGLPTAAHTQSMMDRLRQKAADKKAAVADSIADAATTAAVDKATGAVQCVVTDIKCIKKAFGSGKHVELSDAGGDIVCRSKKPDPSCWNHLAFEAYELYQVQLLSGRDLSEPIWKIMKLYRGSPLGDTSRFDWQGSASPTHITAYNCYLRSSGKAVYREECLRALAHGPAGAMIFYSLIPDDLVR